MRSAPTTAQPVLACFGRANSMTLLHNLDRVRAAEERRKADVVAVIDVEAEDAAARPR